MERLLERSEVLFRPLPKEIKRSNMNKMDFTMSQEYSEIKSAQEVHLTSGGQLNHNLDWFNSATNPDYLYGLMEVSSETDYAQHHIQKVISFFGAMRLFAKNLLERGHRVLYLRLDDPRNLQSIPDNLEWIRSKSSISSVSWQQVDEYRMDQTLDTWSQVCDRKGWKWTVADSQHFFAQREDLALFFKGEKASLLDSFYRAKRKKHAILMAPAMKPEGGEWNFHVQHRIKLERKPSIGMAFRLWDKMAEDKKEALLETAAYRLAKIESL